MVNDKMINLNTVTNSSGNVVENILDILSNNETYSLTTEHNADASLDVVLNFDDNSMNKNSKLSVPIVDTPEKILSSTQSIVSTPETKNSLIDSLLGTGNTTEDSVCPTCNSGTNSLLNNLGGLDCNLICEPNYLKTLILLIETTGLDVKVAINNVIGGLLCPPPKCDLNYIEDVLSLTLAIRDFFGIKSAIGTTTGGLALDPICSTTSLKVEFIID